MTTNTQPLKQFIVNEYGQPNWQYMDEIVRVERNQALIQAGSKALESTIAHTLGFLAKAGSTALECVDQLVQSAN